MDRQKKRLLGARAPLCPKIEKQLQKGITGREFGSPNHLPDMNLALQITYRMRIWPSNILTRHDFFCQYFCPHNYSLSETNVCHCPWPDNNVLASASGMSLSPQIVQAEERNSARLSLALMVHGLEGVHILRKQFLPFPMYNQMIIDFTRKKIHVRRGNLVVRFPSGKQF